MSSGYASPEEHLDDLLALLRAALAVAIERKRGNFLAVGRPEHVAVRASTGMYLTWDDHEVKIWSRSAP
jgi:hypothetical protein